MSAMFAANAPLCSRMNAVVFRMATQCNYLYRSRDSCRKYLSSITRGQDLLADSLAFGARRKIILDSYSPTGFDVHGVLPKVDNVDEQETKDTNQILHMNGSIIAFPHSCYLWNVSKPKDVTLESLAITMLHNPSLEYLFIGSDIPLPPRELNRIRKELRNKNIVVEQLDISNSMGTFNILNGEDRRVAAALVIDIDDTIME